MREAAKAANSIFKNSVEVEKYHVVTDALVGTHHNDNPNNEDCTDAHVEANHNDNPKIDDAIAAPESSSTIASGIDAELVCGDCMATAPFGAETKGCSERCSGGRQVC